MEKRPERVAAPKKSEYVRCETHPVMCLAARGLASDFNSTKKTGGTNGAIESVRQQLCMLIADCQTANGRKDDKTLPCVHLGSNIAKIIKESKNKK